MSIKDENKERVMLNHEKLVAKRVLGKLCGLAWLEQVNQIADLETRCRVANIIYWDFMGNVKADKRVTTFDAHLESFKRFNVDVTAMEFALAQSLDATIKAEMTERYIKRMDGITLAVRKGLELCGYTHAMAVERMGKTAQERLEERKARCKRVRMVAQTKKGTV